MATVNFLYRSNKDEAPLNLRLLFRHNEMDFVLGAKTKFIVSKHYWNKEHKLQRVKDAKILEKQAEVKAELVKISNFILTSFNSTNAECVSKEWLQKQVDEYYNPKEEVSLPNELIKYIDFYIQDKKNRVSEGTIKKAITNKNILIRFEKSRGSAILIKDVNSQFKIDFEEFCKSEGYAHNSTARTLTFIKTICRHADRNGVETSKQLENIKTQYTKTPHIYLNFREIEQIENTPLNADYLENARDWLVISCYLGQRVSDFLRFTSDMIRYEEGEPLLEFTQKKTKKRMTIPVHHKVLSILEKREGEFPRAISDVKYNLYIKEVCKIAGLNEKVFGAKRETDNNGKTRKVKGEFPKYELVSSHIGRRSFATNFYGEIPTTYLKYITGHKKEETFLSYIGKSNKDLAKEVFKFFKKD